MKKFISLILAISMCFIISACGKSEEAINADSLILDIGEVTLESENKIKSAEEAISKLTEKQKEQIENISVLESARATYNELLVNKVQEAITSIGSVTLDSKELIQTARNLYNSCSDDVKNSINNYTVLQSAEEELSSLKINEVTNLISQIGTITLNSGDKIDIAQRAYNNLSSDEKKKVANSGILDTAPEKLKDLKLKNAVSKLNSTTDKVEGITWYKAKCEPYYINTRSYVLPYIGKNSSNTWLRVRYLYHGNEWIFFDSITIIVDGKKYNKSFSYGEVKRDNNADVWEWADVTPSNQDIEMLKEIANSNETIVRFQGDTHHYDLVVSRNDKNGIKDVLSAYEALK